MPSMHATAIHTSSVPTTATTSTSHTGVNGGHASHSHSPSSSSLHSNSLPNTTTPLFQLVNFPSRLVLENVYLNGLHSLRRFGIKNTSPTDIVVKMRSSLGAQISFQLTNENLPYDSADATGSSLPTISTNTAAAAEAGSLTASGHQFNQLFNHVNLIDEVTVAAGETEYVILGFLPDHRGKNRRGKWDSTSAGMDVTNANSGNGSAQGDGVQIYDDSRHRDFSANGLANGSNLESEDFDPNDQHSDNFDSFEVNGLVFFFAYKATSSLRILTSNTTADSFIADSPVNLTEVAFTTSPPSAHTISNDPTMSSSVLPPSLISTHDVGSVSVPPSTESSMSGMSLTPSVTPHKADYQHSVKFRSTVCKSVLYSNIGETGINFEDCVANQEYVKDFTIWNRSEIPLYWQLTAVDVGNASKESWLKFMDYEDSFGEDVEESTERSDDQGQTPSSRPIRAKPIPSYGYRRIRVIFRPKENGDFLFDLLLENLNDAANIEEASIHAAVRAVSRGEDTLTISTGNTMDFGDCCAGMWTRLPMTFSNTGTVPTEIHLKVDGAEVVFDIQTDPGAVLSEADNAEDDKFLRDPDISPGWYESSRRSDVNTESLLDQGVAGAASARNRLREWVEDGPQSPGGQGFNSSAPSLSDSASTKADRLARDQGATNDSGPSSPVTSEGFFPENIQQINSNVEKYLAGQELTRPGKDGAEDDLESENDNTSQQDSTTVSIALSHKKRPSLRSISFSGAQREKELAQAQLHAPQSPVRGNQSTTRIEELFVKPGKERTVIVSYRPTRDSSIEDFQAGKLLKKSFRIIVSYAPWTGLASTVSFSENPQKERKIIQCKSRACTSFVTFEPKSLDFGDTDVGALKSLPIKLMNLSELPATVRLDFQSKVLNCSPSGAITIPPKSGTELKLDIYPRKVNPDYRKQLTLYNLTNRANDQIIEVRSTNIDKNRVTFHSLFYRVLYPGGSNFLDFGNVVVGGISLRTLTISNFTRKWLTLEVTTSLVGELKVYERAREHQNYLNVDQVSGLLSNGKESSWSATNTASVLGDQAPVASRGSSPTLGESASYSVGGDNTKSSLLKRRQEHRDHSSATSESATPHVLGGALASSLALRAKAILFHGDVSQTVGSTPAKFLDLATNKPRESKKVIRRIPTMKELLESTTNTMTTKSTTTDRTVKGNISGNQELTRSPRSLAAGQQSSGVTIVESGPKRQDSSANSDRPTPRQQDQKTNLSDPSNQAPVDSQKAEHPFLSERSLDSLLAAMDGSRSAASSMLFYKASDEENHVKAKMKLVRELQNAITSGELSPISMVSVPPETEHQLVVLFTPSSTFRDHIKGIPKKQDARLFLRLVDFDQETVANNPQFRALLDGDLSQIPLREIMVRSSLVRSIMELGQSNINFGTMDKGEKRTKTIVIQNRSKEPLLYHIRKSGSIASGDIVLGAGKSGVVRGYSKKEVDFIFEPSLAGVYHEKLAIENIQDHDSSRTLSIKANIRKPKHFSIDTQEVDFGICSVGKKSVSRRITVTNSTKQIRTFEVRVDPHEMMPLSTESHYGGQIEFTLEDDPAGQAVVTKEMEDEIEILEQKLKIAKRKGREDKVLKVTARLVLLRKGGVEDKVDLSTPDAEDATPTQEKILDLSKSDPSASGGAEGSAKGTGVNSPATSTPATTPTIKDLPKFKRTDHSIVFTLEGGKTKSVTAYFTALRDQSPLVNGIAEKERLRLQGKIYVHEHKNRDICRDVAFFATVECKAQLVATPSGQCPELSALSPVSAESDEKKSLKIGTTSEKPVKVKKNKDKALKQAAKTDEPLKEIVPLPEYLVLSPPDLDGGKIEQGQKGNFYFKLSNTSELAAQPFKIELHRDSIGSSRFLMDEIALEGTLEPKEVRRITFGYSTLDLGRLRDSLTVLNPITKTTFEFKFTCFSHRPQYLAFPSLDDSLKLDLGHCYVDTGRKYSQVTPLLVENITDDDVYIACASNLSQQVGIYLDERAEKGQVTRAFLKKKSMLTVWVAVQPNLLGGISNRRTGANANGAGGDRDSECRTLMGGIKFTVSLPEDQLVSMDSKLEDGADAVEDSLTQVTSQTVKFTSIIGRSILSVSDTILNLGWTPEPGKPVYGSFTLQNMSSRLPLEFYVESKSGNIILDRTGGVLDGWEVDTVTRHDGHLDKVRRSLDEDRDAADHDSMDSVLMDRSRMWISFRVTSSTPGLFTDSILVTNENNCSQQIEIKVRLFIEPKVLVTNMHGPGYACPLTLDLLEEFQESKPGAPREGLCLPSLTWKNIYVNVHEARDDSSGDFRPYVGLQALHGETEARVEERWIEFLNDSEEVMELVPLSDISVDTLWEQTSPTPDDSVILSDEGLLLVDGFHYCGPIARVSTGQKIQLLVACPAPVMPSSDIASLQSGKSVSVTGNLMVMDRLKKQVVKVLCLTSTFGASYDEVVPLSSDVGKIGHYNSWNPVAVTFEVKNTSDIPLHYEIVLQDCMDLVFSPEQQSTSEQELQESAAVSCTKRALPSNMVDKIEVMLNPRRIENYEIGRRTFPIRIRNLYNPENESVVNVNAVLTEFELGFDRLQDGKLVLPPLTHPLPASALPCDAWFSITNKSLEDIRFEIGAHLSPDVVDYVHLDVLSRFSNSPLRGTISLSPRGSIEVRVRAFPKEGSRLPSDTSALCTPEGLTFGNLWLATKSTAENEAVTKRFAEDIPIRGTLVEGSMFSLSTQRIVFRSLLETSDYEGESDDELSAPDSSRYASSKDPSDDGESDIQQASIVISNLSTSFPLEFQMTLEGPMEYPAGEIIKVTPLDANNCGIVEAGQQLKLVVELVDPRLVISEDIKLYIRNLNSNVGQQQRVLISIVSDNREHRKPKQKQILEDERKDPHHHQNKLQEEPVAPTVTGGGPTLLSQPESAVEVDRNEMQPIISLRGCKRIDNGDASGGRFELDLGQQDMGPANVLRKLVLENPGYDRISYRIKTISSLDKNWIKISRLDGTLEPPTDEQMSSGSSSVHTITLSFSTNVRNVFSTYLLIENVDNPADTKTIRITMEVVARQNLRRAARGNEPNNRVFDVYVNGIDSKNSSSIDMKNLYYGSEYTARSMVVYNRESVPMEFTFKSNLSPSDSTEILFSTSRTSAKLFKTLTVPSENHVRVYIRFFPRPSAPIQAALENGEYRDPDEMELKTVEIYINCRLVKDYQQVVLLKAECYLPAIRVKWNDSVSFVGRLSRESATNAGETADEWKISFQEDYRILGISNLLDIPLDYEIVNDTMYFNLEYPEPEKIVDGKDTHEVRVVPNVKALLRNADNFRREKYVQENITIYNRNRPLENYWIPVRLSFGNVSNFQLSSGYKSSYAFGMIEQHVVNFLSDFNSNAVLVTMMGSSGCSGGIAGVGMAVTNSSSSASSTTSSYYSAAGSQGYSSLNFSSTPSSTFFSPDPYHHYQHQQRPQYSRGPSPLSMNNSGSGSPTFNQPASSGLGLTCTTSGSGTGTMSSSSSGAALVLSPPTSSGPAVGMLGLGRTFQHHSSAPAVMTTTSAGRTPMSAMYHPPAHHPHYLSAEQQESQRKLIDLEFQYHYVVDQLVYYSTIKTGENFFQLASLLFCSLLGNRIFQIWSPAYLKNPRINNNANCSVPAAGGEEGRAATGESTQEQQSVQQSVQPGSSGFTVVDSGHLRQLQDNDDEDEDESDNGDGSGRRRREAQIRVWPESLRKWVEALDYFVSFFPYHTRQLETLKTLHHSLISTS
ncbi:hypothetical protein BGZ83_003300 [Gryganskiella cystojenkinii]|nr:hypothetical protein BGZ83_003300 [Gryganskiella cystojenkinii]